MAAEKTANTPAARRLRIAFAAGAVTDAVALVPMLFPPVASFLWGFEQLGDAYVFAIGYAASLMLGWTLLLVWAYADPVPRRFVAALTLVVIAGLAATEAIVVARGAMPLARVTPTWLLQLALAYLFVRGYRSSVRESAAAQG